MVGWSPWVCHVWDCSREKTEKETNVLGFGHVWFLRVVRWIHGRVEGQCVTGRGLGVVR